eukprot:7934533-Pyramimonas_sp.AAC.1
MGRARPCVSDVSDCTRRQQRHWNRTDGTRRLRAVLRLCHFHPAALLNGRVIHHNAQNAIGIARTRADYLARARCAQKGAHYALCWDLGPSMKTAATAKLIPKGKKGGGI